MADFVPSTLCDVAEVDEYVRLGDAFQQSALKDPLFHIAEETVEKEREMVKELLDHNSELLSRIKNVLKKFHCKSIPNLQKPHATQYWRDVTTHFIANNERKEEFDDMDPFYVVDLGRVLVQMARFRKQLPMVEPYYAVKCNPNPALMAMISALGGCFDCASYAEFKNVIENGLATPEEGIIYANPCKATSELRRAAQMKVRYVTFDNEGELRKLATHLPNCRAVLRIKTNDSAAVCAFSTKFGASMSDVPVLLSLAQTLGISVVGCSFHVGSGNNDPDAYVGSILNARNVFDQGIALGFDMKLLDLGGGYPGTEPPLGADGKPTAMSFEQIAAHIRPVLEEHFKGAKIIAEPGRYFSASTHCLAMNVHSMRTVRSLVNGKEVDEYQYYVNDGLYHSFNCIVYDHAHPRLEVLLPDVEARWNISTIFGPTCDSLDCILKQQPFPDLTEGEWIISPDMGSYTTAAGAAFNGFATRRMEYINSVSI